MAQQRGDDRRDDRTIRVPSIKFDDVRFTEWMKEKYPAIKGDALAELAKEARRRTTDKEDNSYIFSVVNCFEKNPDKEVEISARGGAVVRAVDIAARIEDGYGARIVSVNIKRIETERQRYPVPQITIKLSKKRG